MNYGLDLVYEKYGSHLSSVIPTTIGVIDDGVNLLSDEVIVNSAWNAYTKSTDNTPSTGHGWAVAKKAVSFAPDKIHVTSVRVANEGQQGSLWNVLDGIDYCRSQGCDVVNTSLHISQNTMVAANMEKLRMANTMWSTHYSHQYNYPSYFTHQDVIGQFSSKFAGFGDNILVAIPLNNDNSVASGQQDSKIPSIGVYENAPSWAAPILASATAFLRLFSPELKCDEINNILTGSGKYISQNLRLLSMDKAIEMLTGESLTATTVPITKSITEVHIHYNDGTVEVKK